MSVPGQRAGRGRAGGAGEVSERSPIDGTPPRPAKSAGGAVERQRDGAGRRPSTAHSAARRAEPGPAIHGRRQPRARERVPIGIGGRSGGAASTRARACRQPGGGGWRVPGPVTRSRERRLRSLDARDPGRRWADGGACPAAVAITGLLGSVEGFNEDNAHSLSEPGQRYGNMG